MRNSAALRLRRRVATPLLALAASVTLIVPTASVAAPIPVPENPQSVEGFTVLSWEGDRNKTPHTIKQEYELGEDVIVTFRVNNDTGKTLAVSPVSADVSPFAPPAKGNCRWGKLSSPNRYSCDTPRHRVTAEDKLRGYFTTDSEWDITPQNEETIRVFIPGEEITLGQRNPSATVTLEQATYSDTNANGTVDTADTVTLPHVITNTGNVTLNKIVLADEALSGITLNPNESTTKNVTRTLTPQEVEAASATLTPANLVAYNGKLEAESTQAQAPAPLALKAEGNTPESPNPGTPSTPIVDPESYTPAPPPENGYEEQRIVYNGGGPDRLKNYRIPALIQLNNGHILISYDGRPNWGDAPQPNWIIQQRSIDGGKNFQERTIINKGRDGVDRIGYSDPSYVYDAEKNRLFNFHVYSKNQGFSGSNTSADDNDRNAISAIVAVSDDNGRNWTNKSVTSIIKANGVAGVFATSGNGIQKRFEPHKGRLIQPFVVRINGAVRAVMLYSDDHGETWTRGAMVGNNMDENKVVELSDGSLMLNSRMFSGGTWRTIALSEDGGENWGETYTDYTLIDPRNNASLIQMNPTAAQGSREAKELLFSNAASTRGRQNGSVRYSCDDGRTWPVVKAYRPGAHAYSDLAALKDGTFGVFFEAEQDSLWFGRFTREWLNPFCANFADIKVNGDSGQNVDIPVVIRNDDTRVLPAGTARVSLPNGWGSEEVQIPELQVGQSHTAVVRLTVPETAIKGIYRGEVNVQAGTYALRGDVELTVLNGAKPKLGVEIVPTVLGPARDVENNPYQQGEQIGFNFYVKSTSSLAQTVTPTSGNLRPFLPEHGRGNCRWRDLPASQQYNCNTPKYTLTSQDLTRGYIAPDTVWTVTAADFEPLTVEVKGPEVSLKPRTLSANLTVEGTSISDADGDGYHEVDDVVSVVVKATNTSTVSADSFYFTRGEERSEVVRDLAIDGSATHTWTHTLTTADVEAGKITISGIGANLTNGSLEKAIDPIETEVTLKVQPPADNGTDTPEEEPKAHINIEQTTLVQGKTIIVKGSGFTPGAALRIELHSTPILLGTTTANTAGEMEASITIPETAPVGAHTLKIIESDVLFAAKAVTVEAAKPGGSDNGSTDNGDSGNAQPNGNSPSGKDSSNGKSSAKDDLAKKSPAQAGKIAKTGTTVMTILAVGAVIAGLGAAVLFLKKK